MMECKRALTETGGDEAAAIELLRKEGQKIMGGRAGRATSSGRIAVYASVDGRRGAMIELQCESDPVTKLDEFKQLTGALAKQLATGPGATTPEQLLSQPSAKPGRTLKDEVDDLSNRIREVFNLSRVLRVEASCGGYAHFTGTSGVLVEVEGGNDEAARDVAMHIAAQRPLVVSKEDLEAAIVDKEREILTEAARKEGKPENIIAKMVEGRLKNFYAERVLLEQPFVRDDKVTVGKMASAAGMKVKRYVHWELGKG
jgi:elongation factor Ts